MISHVNFSHGTERSSWVRCLSNGSRNSLSGRHCQPQTSPACLLFAVIYELQNTPFSSVAYTSTIRPMYIGGYSTRPPPFCPASSTPSALSCCRNCGKKMHAPNPARVGRRKDGRMWWSKVWPWAPPSPDRAHHVACRRL